MQSTKRTAVSGPALVRLLARFADLDVHEPGASLSDKLSQWLGWTDAIALSTALSGDPPAIGGARSAMTVQQDACARVRASLASAIAPAKTAAPQRHRARAPVPQIDVPVDYAVYRQRCLSLQQAMESDIGALRGRLRAVLATQSERAARLAVVDAVMEQALCARERTLFAQVPALLGKHFERMRRAGAQTPDGSSAWLAAFEKDLQSVLLAELDVRLQPVDGLLAACRAAH
ncbi:MULTISPECIES: DUF3348 domain-containing protein [unclassified Caballeronia]|uniref:DUF3348 domain-containing protein n=1 Tax=unclassified Caballeronia TaxID=2646786 RepID=UPI00285C0687|nr:MULTISPECIES: DUF3348 domain-containing protein [unclassified Caballeronia]MDR5740402.1 DUF3348 domain-containing protein [Caballeronia sp. LZ016]MDR5808419.1 DUF3348 domain-containing protein [Caballeronia sp. LZ019]